MSWWDHLGAPEAEGWHYLGVPTDTWHAVWAGGWCFTCRNQGEPQVEAHRFDANVHVVIEAVDSEPTKVVDSLKAGGARLRFFKDSGLICWTCLAAAPLRLLWAAGYLEVQTVGSASPRIFLRMREGRQLSQIPALLELAETVDKLRAKCPTCRGFGQLHAQAHSLSISTTCHDCGGSGKQRGT